MKRFISALMSAFIGATPGVALFLGLFWLDVGSSQIPILMYRGIALACVAGLAQSLMLALRIQGRNGAESLLIGSVSVAFAMNLIFLVVFPVTIDRSVSVYLLGQLSRHPTGLTEDQLTERLIHQYVEEYRAVDRRMREQITTGNVRSEGDRYVLTPQGRGFLQFSDVVREIFKVDPRYIGLESPHSSAMNGSRAPDVYGGG